MASLSFNSALDYWKSRWLTWTGDSTLQGHLIRMQLNFADFNLTAGQMDALNATPISLIATPGSTKAIIVAGVFTYVNPGATHFAIGGTDGLAFKYTNGSGAQVATLVPTATVESVAAAYYRSVPLAVVPVLNAALVAHATADVTAGDGSVLGRVFYYVVDQSELA